MRLSDKDLSYSRYSPPQENGPSPSRSGISALLGLTGLNRSRPRDSHSNPTNKSSFL